MHGFPGRHVRQARAGLQDAGEGEVIGSEFGRGHQQQEGVDGFDEELVAGVSADHGVPLEKVPAGEGVEDAAGVGRGAAGEVHGEEAGGENGVGHKALGGSDDAVDAAAELEVAPGTAGLQEKADAIGEGGQAGGFRDEEEVEGLVEAALGAEGAQALRERGRWRWRERDMGGGYGEGGDSSVTSLLLLELCSYGGGRLWMAVGKNGRRQVD